MPCRSGATTCTRHLVKAFASWIYGVALAIGGPGIFAIAFLDSSFISLPQINDILVVLMVTQHKNWMLYYAAMATLGSVAGCYAILALGYQRIFGELGVLSLAQGAFFAVGGYASAILGQRFGT